MRRFTILIIAFAAAAVCARLGVWQLSRLAQRQEQNTLLTDRLAAPVLDLTHNRSLGQSVPRSADSLNFRRARATGVFDFGHELVDIAKSRRGAPGVHVITPLRRGESAAVLVNRGWVYSADGRRVDLTLLAEPETVTVEGVLVRPTGLHRVHPDSVELPYPVLGAILRRTEPPDSLPVGLVVLDPLTLDEGPHLSYAFQWFSFATIAIVGGIILFLKQRQSSA